MSSGRIAGVAVDVDPLRNPDMFRFGGNEAKRKPQIKKVPPARRPAPPQAVVEEKKKARPPEKKAPAPAPAPAPKPTPEPEPEPEPEEEEKDIFGTSQKDEDVPPSFLDDAPVNTGAGDPLADDGKAEKEEGGLSGVYIPKEAMEKRKQVEAEALDEDLVNVGSNEDLAQFEAEKKKSTDLVIEDLPATLEGAPPPESEALDDDLFNMVDGAGAAGGGEAGAGGLADISSYIAQNDKGASDDLFA
uniref:Uncharacterized protein n=1 Tax=Lotharella globosa TaxID=91324 RepID=A0A6V3RMR1_9EUKA